MIEFFKLKNLPRTQRLIKTVKIFEQLEQSLVSNRPEPMLDDFYLKQLFTVVENDCSETVRAWGRRYFAEPSEQHGRDDKLRFVNTMRHHLYRETGVEPAEWDLIIPYTDCAGELQSAPARKRPFFKNVFVYAENIRSPFNLGSLFRTGDAFGVDTIFLSPDCVSPETERAKRSAMGALNFVPHRRLPLERIVENLPEDFPVIALETGGTEINTFEFPREGIVLVGSEELGLTPESLARSSSRVSIKMHGIKASINVGVAFGIFMEKWATAITGR